MAAHKFVGFAGIIAAFGIMLSGFAELGILSQAMLDRYPVIWLIMLFATLSYGLQRAGFFRYMATFTLLWCRRNVAKLTVGFFLLSSVLTYLASDDIVVLVVTPLVLELSRQLGLRDVRIVLLTGVFVASNTLSAALPLGSPANLIFSLALGISFFDYVELMLLPTLVTAVSSLLVMSLVYSFAVAHVGRVWAYDHGHLQMPPFTGMMVVWCGLFLAALVGYSVAMSTGFGFGWVSLPGTVVALATLFFWSGMRTWTASVSGVRRLLGWFRFDAQSYALSVLPWSIVGFAMSFFLRGGCACRTARTRPAAGVHACAASGLGDSGLHGPGGLVRELDERLADGRVVGGST